MSSRGLPAVARVLPWARPVVGGLALLVAGCGAAAPIRADAAESEGGPTPATHPTAGASASSASPPPPAGRSARGVVLLVRTPRHLQAAFATADTMRAAEAASGTPRPFHVIACGDAIESVLRDAAAEPRVRAAVASGVVVTACGMTLEEKGIDAARVSASVTLVANGLIEAIRLQEAGFVSVEL